MAAHAGEKARRTGDFKCKGCNEIVRVNRGDTIPKCHCGASTFEERRNEPGNKSTSKSSTRHRSGEHRRV